MHCQPGLSNLLSDAVHTSTSSYVLIHKEITGQEEIKDRPVHFSSVRLCAIKIPTFDVNKAQNTGEGPKIRYPEEESHVGPCMNQVICSLHPALTCFSSSLWQSSFSVSISLTLPSFVSSCLWSWAEEDSNLLEAKCLYLGQKRIRSHVISAAPGPHGRYLKVSSWSSASTMHKFVNSDSAEMEQTSSQESRWEHHKRQMSCIILCTFTLFKSIAWRRANFRGDYSDLQGNSSITLPGHILNTEGSEDWWLLSSWLQGSEISHTRVPRDVSPLERKLDGETTNKENIF